MNCTYCYDGGCGDPNGCGESDRNEGLAGRLRRLATGRTEWRVQDPVDRCYCMVFDRSTSIDPEGAANRWLAELKAKYPNHRHAGYEVAEVRCFTELEQAAIDAAEALGSPAAPLVAEDGRKPIACGMRTTNGVLHALRNISEREQMQKSAEALGQQFVLLCEVGGTGGGESGHE